MLLRHAEKPLTQEEYVNQMHQCISQIRNAAAQMEQAVSRLPFVSLIDRAQLLQSTQEQAVAPLMDFVHTLTVDLHAAIREAAEQQRQRR